MKYLVILGILLSSNLSTAEQTPPDPFDINTCRGPVMSPPRALELLGNHYEANLALIATGNDTTDGVERKRNVIKGVEGDWYHSSYWPIAPYIMNVSGQMVFGVTVYTPNRRGSESITCKPYGKGGASHVCSVNKKSELLLEWGAGGFFANLTDSCLKMWNQKRVPGQDKQWAYFFEIPY